MALKMENTRSEYDSQSKTCCRRLPVVNVIKIKANLAYATAIISPKPKDIISLIRHREMGIRKNYNIESPFLNLKTSLNINSNEDVKALSDDANISNISMVKGGQLSIFGVWQSMSDWNPDIVSEVFFNSQFSKRIAQATGLQDFCDGYKNSELLMIASNDLNSESGKVIIISRDNDFQLAREHISDFPFYSCCCNSFVKNFAIGSKYTVKIENAMGNLFSRIVQGHVHSVHYNDNGNILYCGLDSGTFSVIDLRQNSTKYIKLFSTGINECCLLENQQIILGTFEGNLSKFDLRMLKPQNVADYLTHAPLERKSPVSVNETLNLLCATGGDNLTRIWSLNGGVPVRVIRPPVVSGAHRAWLLNDPLKATIYLFQNKKVYSCEF